MCALDEFQRAVKSSIGKRLDPKLVQVVFHIFDVDGKRFFKWNILASTEFLYRRRKVELRRVHQRHEGQKEQRIQGADFISHVAFHRTIIRYSQEMLRKAGKDLNIV